MMVMVVLQMSLARIRKGRLDLLTFLFPYRSLYCRCSRVSEGGLPPQCRAKYLGARPLVARVQSVVLDGLSFRGVPSKVSAYCV